MRVSSRRGVLEAFRKTADQASFVLKGNPDQLLPQLYNRLQWQTRQTPLLRKTLEDGRTRFKRPWLRLLNEPVESQGLVRSFTGHAGGVWACSFSPDGKLVVSASDDKTLRLWDVATGRDVGVLKGHRAAVLDCAFSPDGSRIISAGRDRKLRLWSADDGRELHAFSGHTADVVACSFTKDGQRIISQDDGAEACLRTWSVETQRCAGIIRLSPHAENRWALSPDGTLVVTASDRDDAVSLWNAQTGSEVDGWRTRAKGILDCAFSPDGQSILTLSDNQLIHVWDIRRKRSSVSLKGIFGRCAFSPDGLRMVNYGREAVCVWELGKARKIATIEFPSGYDINYFVEGAAFSPDSRRLVLSGDNDVRLFDAKSGKEIATFLGHTGIVQDCAFSPDGRYVVSASADGTLKLWDPEVGDASRATFLNPFCDGITDCAFSPDGGLIVSTYHGAREQSEVILWDSVTGQKLASPKGIVGWAYSCAFSPDGSRVAAGGKSDVVLWDTRTGEKVAEASRPGYVLGCAFSPNGRQIVTATDEGVVSVHDSSTLDVKTTNENRASETAPGRLQVQGESSNERLADWSLSPDGRHMVLVTQGHGKQSSVVLLDVATLEVIRTLAKSPHSFIGCACSSDGRWIAVSSEDGTLRGWDAQDYRERTPFRVPEDRGTGTCFFSPDGRLLASAARALSLWDSETGLDIAVFMGHSDEFRAGAFSPDGRQVVVGGVQGQLLKLSLENFGLPALAAPLSKIRIKVRPRKAGITLLSLIKRLVTRHVILAASPS